MKNIAQEVDQTMPQEEYQNKVAYDRKQFPQKGNKKGNKGCGVDIQQMGEDAMKPPMMAKANQPQTADKGMEGSSHQEPRPQMFIEYPKCEAATEDWQPPIPPKMPLMTQPKATMKGKKKGMAQERQHRKGKVLKRRTVWVISSAD